MPDYIKNVLNRSNSNYLLTKKVKNKLTKRPKTKKAISYANSVKRSSPMKIEKIKIEDWLRHYNINPDIKSLFNVYNYKNIIYNTNLLDCFYTEEMFFEYVYKKLVVFYNFDGSNSDFDNKIKVDLYKDTLYKLVDAFKLLYNQKREYKLYFSRFPDYTKKSYLECIDRLSRYKSFKTEIKNKSFEKDDIINKLKLLNVDLFLDMTPMFDCFLSNDYNVLKSLLYIYTNKKNNIKKGLKKDMAKLDYNEFVEKNKAIELLVKCENKYKLNDIKRILKEISASDLFEMNFNDLVYEIISPLEDAEKKYRKISRIINNFLIPSQTDRFKQEIYSELIKIPNSLDLRTFNLRIFLVNGHGPCYLPSVYEKMDRIDIKRQLPRHVVPKNVKILSTQPYGRLSLLSCMGVIGNVIDGDYGKIFSKSLWNSKTQADFNILENVLNYSYYENKSDKLFDKDKSLEEEKYKRWLIDAKSDISKFISKDFDDTELYKSTIFNFVKYNHLHNPVNGMIHFKDSNMNSSNLGIYEITKHTSETNKFMNNLKKIYSNDHVIKLGLNFDKKYGIDSDKITKNYFDIISYNKYLYQHYLNKTDFATSLENVINTIIQCGDIKSTDKLLIITNQCRGAMYKEDGKYDTLIDLPKYTREKAEILRAESEAKSLNNIYLA